MSFHRYTYIVNYPWYCKTKGAFISVITSRKYNLIHLDYNEFRYIIDDIKQ